MTGAIGLALAALACPPAEEEVTAETVAAAFGLVDGRIMHYEVTSGATATEDHEYKRSSSYAERLVVTRIERGQGWIREEPDGTAAVTDFEALPQQVQIVAVGDCYQRCVEFAPPIPVASYPWAKNARLETTVTATVREASGTSQHSERHTFIVAGEGIADTGEGALEVFEISWQRIVDGGTPESAMLYLAPELGLARIDRFEGASLELSSHEN
ncbi:MAG: hypothetical protein JXR83_05515 [Deltaproteobacteria bacterium]|nr:hypothetical protein [Deltaproteobacteria bacterium]